MKLLVVVDMQNDFVTGALGTKEAEAIVPAVAEKVRDAIREGTPVVFTQDTHGPDYLQTQEGQKLPVPHCIRGTEGWEIVPALQAYVMDRRVFEKPAFGSLGLLDYAAREDFSEIEVIGLCTDICVISNVLLLKAALPEAQISVDAACCAGVSSKSHLNALAAMQVCQVQILEPEAVLVGQGKRTYAVEVPADGNKKI